MHYAFGSGAFGFGSELCVGKPCCRFRRARDMPLTQNSLHTSTLPGRGVRQKHGKSLVLASACDAD